MTAADIAEARARLAMLILGGSDPPWSDADIMRLDALCALGPPETVVTAGPPVVIAPWDKSGGRMSMPGEAFRASALHTWRLAGAACGRPMAAPHDDGRSKT